ncbi:MAG: FAD-dependent protein [Thermodesulfobacteriota bacterium]
MVLKINGLTLALGEREALLPIRVASLLGLPDGAIADIRVIRRSIDARRTRPPRFVYLLVVRLADGVDWRPAPERETAGVSVTEEADSPDESRGASAGSAVFERRPVVAGCGPAGLFAALTLAEKGVPVLLLERGRAVPERLADVRAFWEQGILNPESHVHFGEGGAGTFSDGKLTSRVKNPCASRVKRVLVDMGAPAEILVDARPHIGTDRLREVVVNLRKRLIGLGGEVRFGARVTDFRIHRGGLVGIVVNDSEEIRTGHLILATGQSAADTYRKLAERGVALAPKPFAIGLRVEHPQELINRIQYGRWAGHPDLPPADYFLTAKVGALNRSCYSFCMCPGGHVIGCSAEAGGVITNGMSRLRRESPCANSAVVVNVQSEDLGGEGPLAGLAFRRHWEERAFLAGGSDYCAPAQRLTDFLSGKNHSPIGRCSFLPGVKGADLREVLPPFVVEGLKRGFAEFERKMPGFITGEAILIGVETRTSSPVRITRGEDGQGVNLTGLYPCGEGAGYAGGIISSALDGIRAAERLVLSLGSRSGHRG